MEPSGKYGGGYNLRTRGIDDVPVQAVETDELNNNNAPLIQESSTIAAEIETVFRRHPELGNSTPEVRGILVKMLEASVENKTIIDFRNPRKGELRMILNARRQDFLAYCETKSLGLKLDETGEPLLFTTVHEASLQLAGEQRLAQMAEVIRTCRGTQVLEATRADDIQALYSTCSQERELIASIRTKIEYLKGRSGLSSDDLQQYDLIFQHTGRAGRPLRIRVSDDRNLLMGYSIFDLLYSIQIRGDKYYGELEYILTNSEMAQLNTYLSSLVTWIDDFTNILADLIGPNEDPNHYIELAQRTRREIIEHPIRMSSGVVESLKEIDVPTCMIMGHLSLNLVDHPQRDFLKAKFQGLYDSEHVLDSAGEAKHFHVDEPYRSNLGLVQLRAICPGLNKLIKLQQLTTNFTGKDNLEDGLNALKDWGIPNELDLIIQYKIQSILETYRAALGNQTPRDTAMKLDLALADLRQLDQVEAKSLQLCQILLTRYTAPFFRTADVVFSPTREQISALYGGVRNIRYEGNQRHRNVAKLFTKLRGCEAFKATLEGNPGFSHALTQLKSELIWRLNRYHTLRSDGYYGRSMVDETVRYFEQYVARIVYADESKVTAESIERSIQILSGIIGDDMHHGCDQGLAGRMNDVLIALTTQTGDDLRDHMRQFQKECLEEVFQQDRSYREGGENSMLVRVKGELADYLGLTLIESIGDTRYRDLSNDAKRFLKLYLAHSTPMALYTKAYQFLTDKFWQLNSENDDEGIYRLLETLGFEASHDELDKCYRVNGEAENRWQYAFFQQDLPRHLVAFLINNQYLTVKPVGNSANYLQRDGEELTRVEGVREIQVLPPVRQDPQQELADTNPRRYGYVPQSALPDYDRMTS